VSACILIVDDNPTNLKLATEVLAFEGHAISQALDADEALRLLETLRPDLILMDIALPGMDGLELTRRLKASVEFARTPIVALSAFAMKGDQEKAFDAGCDGYITKPIDTRRFPAQVGAYLSPGEPA
jgi:CheY-like chemotaxis protein